MQQGAMDLRQSIRQRGLKQGWIARQIGLSEPAFSRIVNGLAVLPEGQRAGLAKLLHVSDAELARQLAASRQWAETT